MSTININEFKPEDIFANEQSFEEQLQVHLENDRAPGSVVKGTVVAIKDGRWALISVGSKSEGIVSIKEFEEVDLEGNAIARPDLKEGDEVDVFIERLEGRDGRTIISREKAKREIAWRDFQGKFKENADVEGIIIGRVKGGFAVNLGNIIAFLPASQVDVRPVKDISTLVDLKQPFKIVKMDEEQGNIVVSRKAILEEHRQDEKEKLLSSVSEGAILEGIVKNITDYGAFIDLGAMDGLLHITDISWNKISHPSEILTLGQKVKVMVVKYNAEVKRLSLGLKQLEENPWSKLQEKYTIGSIVKGQITSIMDYGAKVELEPNIEGLLYHTEIQWGMKNIHPSKLLEVGQEVEVKILDFNVDKHKINLSIKQCQDNPWEDFAAKYPIGSLVDAEVVNIVDFGMFVKVEIEEGKKVDCLVPLVEVSWSDAPEKDLAKYNVGDNVSLKVINIDASMERVILSVKRLEQENFASEVETLKKDDVVTCRVIELRKDGIMVEAEPSGVKGFIKKLELSKYKQEQRSDRFAVDERVDAKVISIDKDKMLVNLSIRASQIEEEKKVIAEYGSTSSGATLGNILGDALGKVSEAKDEAKKSEATAAKSKPAPAKKEAVAEGDVDKEEKETKKKVAPKKAKKEAEEVKEDK